MCFLTLGLCRYWKGEGILADSWAFTPTHPEGLNFYAEKIARAIEHGLPLNVGVIGSSVAAGHDNCAYDSFENQLQRTLDEPMKKSGIQFTVNNAGQGGGCGDNMYNQVNPVRMHNLRASPQATAILSVPAQVRLFMTTSVHSPCVCVCTCVHTA